MGLDPFRFFYADGTGMGFLLAYADQGQDVQDGFAFDFQLSCQVIDSNLIHASLNLLRNAPLSLHINLTVNSVSRRLFTCQAFS
jgi:hypothetical protein